MSFGESGRVFIPTFVEIVGEFCFKGGKTDIVGVAQEESGTVAIAHVGVFFFGGSKIGEIGAIRSSGCGVMKLSPIGFEDRQEFFEGFKIIVDGLCLSLAAIEKCPFCIDESDKAVLGMLKFMAYTFECSDQPFAVVCLFRGVIPGGTLHFHFNALAALEEHDCE